MNILETETDFSGLIRLLEAKTEDFITVVGNGKPVSKITSVNETPISNRIGIAKGKYTVKGDFDADNEAIADLMTGGAL